MPNLPFKTIKDLDTADGLRVLLRTSLNVPIRDGVVQNKFRITRGLATLRSLAEHGCKVVVCGHIGSDGEETTEPIAHLLAEMGFTAAYVPAVSGDKAKEAVSKLEPGSILVLENVRRDKREKENDPTLAAELAELADVYVNDAFAASHREHASLVGVPKLLPSYAGLNFVHEYEALSAMRTPQSPALFMLGGAKFATKLPLVEQFLEVYDHVFIGGALANDLFKALGYEVGTSLVSDIDLTGSPLLSHPKLLLPVDVVVTDGTQSRACGANEVKAHEKIVDVGPASVEQLRPLITQAKNILWNGPFGNYEAGFAEQTLTTAKLVADSAGHSVVGGGDTVASIEQLGLQEKFDFLSTAGGAMLVFLETGTLPGIEALKNGRKQ